MSGTVTWLWLECLAIFIITPGLFGFGLVNTPLILIPLLLITFPAALWLGRTRGFNMKVFWCGNRRQERLTLRFLLWRFLLMALLLLFGAAVAMPQQLFDLPRQAPFLWLLVVVGYPLLSVYPQELLFRAFFFSRYRRLFQHDTTMLVVNTLLFGWMHIAFANLPAVLMSLIGGGFFATTYRRTASLRLVCLEHALYGVLIFTLGYGRFFLFEHYLLRP